jgi:hypothetical protein
MPQATISDSTPIAIGRRAHSRVRLDLPADLVTLDGRQHCRLINLSVCGANLRIEPPPAKGTCGFLRFCGAEAFGTVVWTHSKHCGVDFDEPIPLETVTAMRDLAAAHPWDEAYLEQQAIKAWIQGGV